MISCPQSCLLAKMEWWSYYVLVSGVGQHRHVPDFVHLTGQGGSGRGAACCPIGNMNSMRRAGEVGRTRSHSLVWGKALLNF